MRPETGALRDRLSRLSEASLRITESLDLDTILQGVIDGARSLTGARYGALLVLDDAGRMQDLVASGMTPEERRRLGALPKGLGLLEYLSEIEGPLRLAEIASHPSSVGFPEGHPPMKTFLGAPVRHRGERLGNIYLTSYPALLSVRGHSPQYPGRRCASPGHGLLETTGPWRRAVASRVGSPDTPYR